MIKLGMDCVAYLGTTESLLTSISDSVVSTGGTWSEMTNVTDVTLNLESGSTDVTTRGNNGWRANAATLKDGTVEFSSFWDTSDPIFKRLFNAWLKKKPIPAMFLTGAADELDAEGLVSNFVITNANRSEPLEEGVKCDFTLKPSSFTFYYPDDES